MTVNARELIGLICAMLYGRGKGFAEIEALGRQLKDQFDGMFPGVIEAEAKRYPRYQPMPLPNEIKNGTDRTGDDELKTLQVINWLTHMPTQLAMFDVKKRDFKRIRL